LSGVTEGGVKQKGAATGTLQLRVSWRSPHGPLQSSTPQPSLLQRLALELLAAVGEQGQPTIIGADPDALTRSSSEATALAVADHRTPPGRVRTMFKKLAPPLNLSTLIQGFQVEFGVDSFAKEGSIARTRLAEAFDKVQKDGVLTSNHFSRFYCEALFHWADDDNNGTLELAEFQNTLGYLVKPNADGTTSTPVIAFPPEFTAPDGTVHLPMSWFWPIFSSMP